MQSFLRITKALSDETRVRALMAMRDRELCLCQLVDLLRLAPSTVSKHMSILHQAGLITRRKEGRWHFYRLADPESVPEIRQLLTWALTAQDESTTFLSDQARLETVCERNLEDLSACYKT